MDYLARNRDCYESLVDAVLRLEDRAGPDLLLSLIGEAAWFATTNHSGVFADHRLENLAFAIGSDLDRLSARHAAAGPVARLNRPAGRRHVLHVATEVAGIGGHTRTIQNWAELDRDSVHSLALTLQRSSPVPSWVRSAICRSGGRVVSLPWSAPPLARARWLRDLARDADCVLVHHFSEDPVPIAAFAAPYLPPVAIVNQSDHVFWLGSSVADTVINLRQVGRVVSERRRSVRHNTLLPIPLTEPGDHIDRAAARRQLGIPEDRVVLLSVGRPVKYVPTSTHDFFRTGSMVLAAHLSADLHLVGVSPEQAGARVRPGVASRFKCAGEVEAPGAYRSAADVYLEGFPFGSQTAMLEAGLAGLAPVPAYAPLSPLLVTQDEAYDDLLPTAPTEQAYLATVSDLISSPARRDLGAECARRVRACHIGTGWLGRLADVYRTIAGLTHAPAPIVPAPAAESADDLGLSLFHAYHTDGGSLAPDLRYKLCRAAFDVAYAAREAGDYSGARRLLHLARRAWGDDGSLGRARAKLVPHWLMRLAVPRRLPTPVVMS